MDSYQNCYIILSMKRVKKILKSIILLFSKIELFKFIFGIEHVVRRLRTCRPFLIATILKNNGAHIGNDINFKGHYTFDNVYEDKSSKGDFSNLTIGNKCVIGKSVFFDLTDQIILGDDVGIGAQSMLMTHIDIGRMPMSEYYPRQKAPIKIGSGTFLGAHVIILHGVELGTCCVVAAGTVITKSFPDYSLIAGVPGRLVRNLNESKNT